MIALSGAAALGFSSLRAATITVTSIADNGVGSLREALANANNGDTVVFDSSLSGQLIALTSGQLVVSKSISITGPGGNRLRVQRSTQLGTPYFRILYVGSGNTVTISGLDIEGGHADGDAGGGIFNDENSILTLNDCSVSSNSASAGGGIYSRNATLTVNDCTFEINSSNSDGGAIYSSGSFYGNATLTVNNSLLNGNSANSGLGGGILNAGFQSGNATATVTSSLIMGNSAVLGGGIYNDGDTSGHATVSVSNSTFSINSAYQSSGGGICNDGIAGEAHVTVKNSTFSWNKAINGGGIYNDGRNLGIATVTIGNTILNVGPAGLGANFFNNNGTVNSLGYNLSSDNSSSYLNATGDRNSTDPMLAPIAENGGPSVTHALLSGSPAIDAGDPSFAPPPDYDQRGPGYPRVLNNRVDIGSFETQPTPTPTATPTPTPTATPRGHGKPPPHPTPHH